MGYADQDGGGKHMERFQGAMLGIFRKQNFVTEYEGGEGVKVNLQVTNSHNWRKSGVPFMEPGNPGERCPLRGTWEASRRGCQAGKRC